MRLAALLASTFLASSPAAAGDWSTYANERFGYSIEVPPGLEGLGEAPNGDGQVFQDAEGSTVLRVWAHLVVAAKVPEGKLGLAYERRTTLERWKEEGLRVTYQPRGADWAVLSGKDGQGQVHYFKALEQGDVLVAFHYTHPAGDKPSRDATGRVARSLKLVPRTPSPMAAPPQAMASKALAKPGTRTPAKSKLRGPRASRARVLANTASD